MPIIGKNELGLMRAVVVDSFQPIKAESEIKYEKCDRVSVFGKHRSKCVIP